MAPFQFERRRQGIDLCLYCYHELVRLTVDLDVSDPSAATVVDVDRHVRRFDAQPAQVAQHFARALEQMPPVVAPLVMVIGRDEIRDGESPSSLGIRPGK